MGGVAVFLGAGGEEDGGEEDNDDDGDNEERGSDVHSGLLACFRVSKKGIGIRSSQLLTWESRERK